MILRQIASTAKGSLFSQQLDRALQQLWPSSLQRFPLNFQSCFAATPVKAGSVQTTKPRSLVAAVGLQRAPHHPEIPGSHLLPTSGSPQATSGKSRSAQPQPISTTKERSAKHAKTASTRQRATYGSSPLRNQSSQRCTRL